MHQSGEEELLSPGQVALFRLLLANPRKVLTRDDIMAAAPAENLDAFDRSIDSRIVRLRRKLDDGGGRGRSPVMVASLRALGVVVEGEGIAEAAAPAVLGGGHPVGEIRAAL